MGVLDGETDELDAGVLDGETDELDGRRDDVVVFDGDRTITS